MTQGLLRAIRSRDKKYRELRLTDMNSEAYEAKVNDLKLSNKIIRKAIRKAKKDYYEEHFTSLKNDIKKTWASINEILSRTIKKKEFPQYLSLIHI